MSHFDWKLLRRKKVIPADRRILDKEETWTLSADHTESHSAVADQEIDSKVKLETQESISTEKCTDVPPEKTNAEGLTRTRETRKSRSKRVKNYLKKCKGALSRNDESSVERRREHSTSWYVDEKKGAANDTVDDEEAEDTAIDSILIDTDAGKDEEESILTEKLPCSKLLESNLDSDSKNAVSIDALDFTGLFMRDDEEEEDRKLCDTIESQPLEEANDDGLNKCDSNDTLIAEASEVANTRDRCYDVIEVQGELKQNPIENQVDAASTLPVMPINITIRGDAATLVRCYLGPIYGESVLHILTRQARDILVCAYHGNLDTFVRSYLSPAAKLLYEVKRSATKKGEEFVIPEGWPLTLGGSGLVLRLGELEASSLRLGECYLCVRSAAATATATANALAATVAAESVEQNTVEIALVWRSSSMRAPGILGWDREEEFMDWRDTSQNKPPAASTSETPESVETKWRLRRRSRDDTRVCRTRDSSEEDANVSLDQHDCSRIFQEACDLGKSSIIESWGEEVRSERRSSSSSRCSKKNSNEHYCAFEGRNSKLKRSTRVVSPSKMEKWKETTRHDTRSRVLAPYEISTPVTLEKISSVGFPKEWRDYHPLTERADISLLPNDVADSELPAYINTLLLTVERKIERVSIDDLTFPCTACRNIDIDDPLLGCKCAGDTCECNNDSCDCGSPVDKVENIRSFEVAGIKHIDSEDEEEEVRMGFGTKKRIDDIASPRTIHDISDRILNCGLTFPGYVDTSGRPVFEFDSRPRGKEIVTSREMASLFLYLSRLPSPDAVQDGFTLLIAGDTREDVETVDRALNFLLGKIKVPQALLLRSTPKEGTNDLFPRSHLKPIVVDESTLEKYIPRRAMDYSHDQFIAYYKEYDSTMTEWQAAGRRLALEMSDLKECTSLSGSLTPLSRLLMDPTLRRTSRDAEEAMAALEERAAPLMHVEHIRLSLDRARRLLEEVGNAASRLESSFESRRATIRNLAVLRSIEDQAREVISWLCKKGEDILTKHAQHTASSLTTARIHEREFEKFYFTSMRHLDKGSDLAEAASASGLRELARSLKHHLRGFGSRLEDRREYLEDTSRCCLLQDRAYEWAQEARMAGERRAQQFLMARPPLPPEHFTEMMSLAEKLGNEILLEQCRIARNKCVEALELARTNSAPGSPARRRSLANSNSDSVNSWEDALAKRASWDDSDSCASYAGPMGSVGSGGSSGRPILDNIAELRESAEQLLDCSPPRTPPRSPPPRRLVKPPVNSHLHRAPSIAPGMKVKKTILLIMREMIQTERDYVKSLEYIIENYIPELVREDIPQSLRGQRNVIFGNVEKIYEFHSQHFLRELEQCEQSPMMVGQSFLRHEKKFYLYALYNKNKPNSDSLMAEYGSTFFKAKQMELGDKMDLASYLLKPVQRMGKYALLLQQLVKAGTDLSEQLSGKDDDENKDDMERKPVVEGEADLRSAEQMVRFQLRHGNDLLAMDSLRDCDVNVKEQGRLLRQNEFLVWQGKGKKCLRQVFLFEDLILFSKARRFPDRKNLDIYIYKHSIKTTDIGLTAVIADSPHKFEIWFRKRKPGDTYTLQCASEDIKKAWTEELSNLLWKQALRNREVRLAEMSSMGIGNKPCLDIRPSADQISDRSISVAQLSKTPRFRNSIAVSANEDSGRCSRRPHSVISVSSSSSSGGSSGPPTTLNLGLDTSPRPHHRSSTLNSQCSVESGIIADISIVSDDGGDGTDRSHWNSTLESPTSQAPSSSTPLQSPMSSTTTSLTSPSTSDANLTPYDQDVSINL